MRIAYVGMFSFPDGDAGAVRVSEIGRALRSMGHEVVYFGIERAAREAGRLSEGSVARTSKDGLLYVSAAPHSCSLWGRVGRQLGIVTGGSILSRLVGSGDSAWKWDAVIAYQAPSMLLVRLKQHCRRNRTPLLCDAVEWYDPRQVPLGWAGPWYWDSEWRMRIAQKRTNGIIAISSLLADYYASSGCRVLKVPALIDEVESGASMAQHRSQGNGMRMVYAGNPGRKDLLGNVVRGLLMARREGSPACLKVVGLDVGGIRACLGRDQAVIEELGDGLVAVPRMSREGALAEVAEADFLPLLRPYRRYANAGFPTKVVESLSLGVPVLANLTSDLGTVLDDGQNGLVLPDESARSMADGIHRAMAMRAKWPAMRLCARRRAVEQFSWRAHASGLDVFLRESRYDEP